MIREKAYRFAAALAVATIVYNLVEGLVSIWFGAADETLSLFGFGIDSFVEVVSGIGIWHMIRRIRQGDGNGREEFERQALRITGWAFHLLAAGLILSAGLSLYGKHEPVSTFWGLIVSVVSISFMWLLIRLKTRVGRQLNSAAILADAACSRACLYLSFVLLASSAGYRLTGVGSLDAFGALGIALFSYREGKEALAKAAGGSCSCNGKCST